MRGFATVAMLALTITGLSACNRNKAANNSASANSATSTNAAAPAAAATPAASGPEYRAAFIGQCEQQVAANPNAPAGLDVAGACGCAYDAAFTGTPDVVAATQAPEGQQRFAQALAQCLQDRAGNIAPPEGAEEEGGEEAK